MDSPYHLSSPSPLPDGLPPCTSISSRVDYGFATQSARIQEPFSPIWVDENGFSHWDPNAGFLALPNGIVLTKSCCDRVEYFPEYESSSNLHPDPSLISISYDSNSMSSSRRASHIPVATGADLSEGRGILPLQKGGKGEASSPKRDRSKLSQPIESI